MKRLILLAFCASLLWTGCSKSPAPKGPEQFDRYIFFSQQVESKASLINSATDMKGKSFGVVGFSYPASTTWGDLLGTTPLPTPNVFYDENGALVNVETVSCDATTGAVSYAPLQGWYGTQKYAFFACYPVPAAGTAVSLVSTTGQAYTGGAPAIQYSNPSHEKALMVDVMTAPAIRNAYWKSATLNSDGTTAGNNPNGELTFAFTHSLSSLGVKVKKSTTGGILVNSVSLAISGLKNQAVTIPLNDAARTLTAATTTSATCALTIANGEKTITEAGVEIADKLIFIPQTDNATITVTINYTRQANGGYAEFTDTMTLSAVQTALQQGKKHLINLNFTESNVTVNVTTGEWTSYSVEHGFN
ncbi:MAG: fimbrillin family protein [Bacteroidales bacterium]|nr:fimbrillin family protein [Bacteroidales bacterium]